MITTRAQIRIEKEISESLFLISVKFQRYKEWIPGMFMQISLKERTASEPWLDGHSFSFASWGNEKALILVRREGIFTTELIKRSKEGFITSVRYAFGNFLLNSNKNKVFIAGGAGISVFLSYIDYMNLTKADLGDTLLIYSTKRKCESLENIYGGTIPKFLSVKQYITGSKESSYTGRFKIEQLTEAIPDLRDREYFLCGPPNFNSHLIDELNAIGVDPKVEQWEK